MPKGKKKSGNQVNWLAEIKRNEQIYGCVAAKQITDIYPHLRKIIWKSNMESNFRPDLNFLPFKSKHYKLEEYYHPYEDEINRFCLAPNFLVDHGRAPNTICVPESYSVKWINEKEQLCQLALHLKNLDHVFVDLENHSWRSYRGITALLQISDGNNVYFLDTLKLYNDMKPIKEIFADPNIVKVLHASQNDIRWLERDFSIYVVGLLDTQIMYRVLNSANNISYKDLVHSEIPTAGLDKAVRSTDFRNRPLHEQQQKYVFLDVYYLPFMYYNMLSKMNFDQLCAAVGECRKIALSRYKHPDVTSIKSSDSESLKYLKIARDIAAKKEDVNPEFLCSVSALEKLILKNEETLRITTLPLVHPRFLAYKEAILVALKGVDPTSVFETEYRDLGIPFPYRPPLFCFNCESTDHVKRDCLLPKSVGKEKKRLHYLANPEKKINECRRRNAKVKLNPAANMKKNARNNRRLQRKRINALFN